MWVGLRAGSEPAPDSIRGRGCVGGLQLFGEGVDACFVAGDAVAEFAECRDIFNEVLDASVLGVEALVHGVETLADVLILVIEALVDGVKALVD